MSSESLLNRYALALYQLGKENKKLPKYVEELNVVSETIEKDSFLEYLKNPRFSLKEKTEKIDKVYKKCSKEIVNLLKLLVQFKRIEHVQTVINCFLSQYRAEKNITEVKVVTAVDLPEDSRRKLLDKLKKKYDGEIILNEMVDKSIIGGVKLIIGDHVIDGTLKTSLKQLQQTLE